MTLYHWLTAVKSNVFLAAAEPYTPTGNFEVDFCELCNRAGFPSMQVVPRPHRPPTPSPIPQDITPVTGRQKDGMSVLSWLLKVSGKRSVQ